MRDVRDAVDQLVELGQLLDGRARIELAQIAVRIARTDELASARAARLLKPAVGAELARTRLRSATELEVISAWAALLPEAESDLAVLPSIEAAIAGADWSSIVAVTSALSRSHATRLLHAAFDRRAAAADFDAAEIYALPHWARDASHARHAIARELAAPTVYAGWRLGEWAAALPDGERAAVLDHALDAFARIAPTPLGPGNDPGPFCELAHLLDERQVRRALAIVEQMAHLADWGFELDTARASLAIRLAALGFTEAALAVNSAITDRGERAWGLGAIQGHRVNAGLAWSAVISQLDLDELELFLHGICMVFESAPPPAEIEAGCRALARAHGDPDYATDLLDQHWAPRTVDPPLDEASILALAYTVDEQFR